MYSVKVLLSVAGTYLMILLSCCTATEERIIQKPFITTIYFKSCPKGSFVNLTRGEFPEKSERVTCKPCPVGTFCSSDRCSSCADCERGHEAQNNGSIDCTECARGYFKAYKSSALCSECPAGFFASGTGQINCIQCPARHYCKAGAIEPTLCESYHACPLGTGTPVQCDAPWVKSGDDCQLSTALIVVICIITVPIVIAVIALIVYKVYKYCKRRRYAELYASETEPLCRQNSRLLQEPIYTGLWPKMFKWDEDSKSVVAIWVHRKICRNFENLTLDLHKLPEFSSGHVRFLNWLGCLYLMCLDQRQM